MRATCAQKAAREVRWLIEQAQTTGVLVRQATAGTDTFYGPHETTEEVVAPALVLEMQTLPARTTTEVGADLLANVLPDSGVQEKDIIVFGDQRYRVTEVKPYNYFGTVTHLGLRLLIERRHHG